MQHILVGLVVAMAAFFIGRRWRSAWRGSGTASCGCCSGCNGVSRPQETNTPFPMHKP